MDSVNPVPSSQRAETSQLAAGGLVLWQVATKGKNLWCLVFDLTDGFHIVLDTDPYSKKPVALVEHHDDIVSAVNRATAWKARFVALGWTEVDVE